jgi:DNA-binding GntR family transcriptional regulator
MQRRSARHDVYPVFALAAIPPTSNDEDGAPQDRRRLAPVRRQKLADLAYDAIRDSITAGVFAMGERLVETRLAADLGMSRAPIREALRRLLEEGLVVERAHHGMFVRTFEGAEIVDLYNARLAIEAAALRLFVRRGASTAPLREQIARRRQAVQDGRFTDVVAADFALHEEVMRGSGNEVLYDLFRKISAQTLIAIALSDAAMAEYVDEHVPVVEALERGDEDAAVAAFLDVVVATVDRITSQLGSDSGALLRRTETPIGGDGAYATATPARPSTA